MSTSPTSDPQKKETELQKENRFLAEDSKINFLMETLAAIRFGKLTIHKHNGKISSYTYEGETKFMLNDFGEKKGSGKT